METGLKCVLKKWEDEMEFKIKEIITVTKEGEETTTSYKSVGDNKDANKIVISEDENCSFKKGDLIEVTKLSSQTELGGK